MSLIRYLITKWKIYIIILKITLILEIFQLRILLNNEKIGSDIALYLANIDTKNKEKYICKAFEFNTNILNLLRIINNGYYKKHEEDVKNRIVYVKEKNLIEEKIYYLLQFFIGNFEEFYNESIRHKELLGWTNSFEKTSVYLWLLLLNQNDEKTKSYNMYQKEKQR